MVGFEVVGFEVVLLLVIKTKLFMRKQTVWKLPEPSKGLGGARKMTEESAIIVVVMSTTSAQTETAHN